MGDPYENLAIAIIKSAARDYLTVLRKIKKNPRNKAAMQDALELERFFHSQWYGCLTSVDGNYLIDRLREEVKNK
ncbi:MAG: hypothetical protein LKE44_08445 [Eubacterium sp.]|jgi:hypothetical protein|nr:hypothetical protein [Eubacterium sp.]